MAYFLRPVSSRKFLCKIRAKNVTECQSRSFHVKPNVHFGYFDDLLKRFEGLDPRLKNIITPETSQTQSTGSYKTLAKSSRITGRLLNIYDIDKKTAGNDVNIPDHEKVVSLYPDQLPQDDPLVLKAFARTHHLFDKLYWDADYIKQQKLSASLEAKELMEPEGLHSKSKNTFNPMNEIFGPMVAHDSDASESDSVLAFRHRNATSILGENDNVNYEKIDLGKEYVTPEQQKLYDEEDDDLREMSGIKGGRRRSNSFVLYSLDVRRHFIKDLTPRMILSSEGFQEKRNLYRIWENIWEREGFNDKTLSGGRSRRGLLTRTQRTQRRVRRNKRRILHRKLDNTVRMLYWMGRYKP